MCDVGRACDISRRLWGRTMSPPFFVSHDTGDHKGRPYRIRN